ncbi:MAG: ribonuclease HII [Candidatus Fermentibacter sp.]|nr:ribonuclease HII [Candidatus Fermentibacter sp.]
MPPGSRRSASTSARGDGLLGFDTRAASLWGRVAGIDEVGRGPLAGPLVACCVVLPPGRDIPGVFDSKALSPARRAELEEMILDACLGRGMGVVEPSEIDSDGMSRSVAMSFRRAAGSCPAPADVYLIDGLEVRDLALPARFFVKGDSRSLSIAAASILAKVHRDRLMAMADSEWPGYGFARNSGYGTAEHLEALRRLGPCPVHRRSFAPVARTADLFGGW